MTVFREAILNTVRVIPRGSVLTYREVAERAGFPGAARAVGSVMKSNFDLTVPCHRVIRSDGSAGRYNRGDAQKIALLTAEGAL